MTRTHNPPLRICKCGRVHRAWRADTYCKRCTKEEGRGGGESLAGIKAAYKANQNRLRERLRNG